MKNVLPVLAFVAAASFAGQAVACDQHQSHAALKTVEAVKVPAPVVVIEPAAQTNVTEDYKVEGAMSAPLGAAYQGCNRQRKDQTVYLTQ